MKVDADAQGYSKSTPRSLPACRFLRHCYPLIGSSLCGADASTWIWQGLPARKLAIMVISFVSHGNDVCSPSHRSTLPSRFVPFFSRGRFLSQPLPFLALLTFLTLPRSLTSFSRRVLVRLSFNTKATSPLSFRDFRPLVCVQHIYQCLLYHHNNLSTI